MAALVESKATALNKGNKKYSYITDFFDIQHVAGRGSFGTVFQALLRCEYDSRPRGTGSTASNLALKKISLSSGQTIIKEIDALLLNISKYEEILNRLQIKLTEREKTYIQETKNLKINGVLLFKEEVVDQIYKSVIADKESNKVVLP